ncbi:MAG: hypothetical protein KatS3mg031_2901 [Chitinophagales bacterium]|nr:MAG: hypothetical protein KatS3mg031_2901 [Chitinophagales bacterium]
MFDADFINEIIPEVASVAPLGRLYRIDAPGGLRWYMRKEGEVKKYYLSATSFASATLPAGEGLRRWWKEAINPDEYAARRAEYGTLMQLLFVEISKKGVFHVKALEEIIEQYPYEEAPAWRHELLKDAAAWAQFMHDNELRIIAAEFPVWSDEMHIAGTIDFVVEMNFNKKRINAIIDVKSGKKGFYDSHELQLEIYRRAWNENYGKLLEVEYIFNFAPKDWRTAPTYTLKNQTGTIFKETILQRVQVAKAEGLFERVPKIISWNYEPVPIAEWEPERVLKIIEI